MNHPGSRYTGIPAKWDADGNAENIEAALCDALQWLMRMHKYIKTKDNQKRLSGCIQQAKQFVGNEQLRLASDTPETTLTLIEFRYGGAE